MITVSYVGLDGAPEATGTVIVIDVLRAFTTAAFAFDAGAEAISVVSTVEEAFAMREGHPERLIMGEEDGLPVEGFDLDNSPAALIGRDLTDRRLIQRTSSGTQGVVRSRQATYLFATGLTCARATVQAVRALDPREVTMVITGSHAEGLRDEDLACADYLRALIRGGEPDDEEAVRRVIQSRAAEKFRDPARPQFSLADLDCAVAIDRFCFAMSVRRTGEHFVMESLAADAVRPPRAFDTAT